MKTTVIFMSLILVTISAFIPTIDLNEPVLIPIDEYDEGLGLDHRADLQFYVSPDGNDSDPGTLAQPFATLEKARDAVRASGEDGATVYLRGGIHNLTDSILFTSLDSGSPGNPNIYRSYPGEQAMISSRMVLEGIWTQYSGDIYALDVGGYRFNNLFVNDSWATRAREPDVGYYHIANVEHDTRYKAFNFSGNDIDASWTNLDDVEICGYMRWEQNRFRIDHVIGQKVYHQGEMKNYGGYDRGWDWGYNDSAYVRYYVENVFEGLDQPGEWYLNNDTGILYYHLKPGEDISHLQFVVPTLEQLIYLQQTEFIQFLDLTICETGWDLPATGYNSNQAGIKIPTLAAIRTYMVNNLTFADLTITRIGGGYCLRIHGEYNTITRNHIFDCGAGGIRLSSPHDHGGGWDGVSHHNEISFNLIHGVNHVYKECIPILIQMYGYNHVANNTIFNTTYIGISVGWAWNNISSPTRYNIIEGNHIHHVMQELYDGGGIYLLGNQPGTIVRNNTIHDIRKTVNHTNPGHMYGLDGMYIDQGGKYINLTGNLVYRVNTPLLLHRCPANVISGNIFIDPDFNALRYHRFYDFSVPHDLGNIVFNNVVYSTSTTSTLFNEIMTGLMEPNLDHSDYNVYHSAAANPLWNFDDWKDTFPDFDRNSSEADPHLVDYGNEDFRLEADSIAIDLGFDTEWLIKNDNPMIQTSPPADADEDQEYSVVFSALDHYPHNGVLSWDMSSNAEFLSINSISGELSGTPFNEHVGIYWVNVSVTDTKDGFSFVNYTLNVVNTNDPPSFTTLPAITCLEDQLFYQQFIAEDIDQPGDVFEWSLITNASFLSITSAGNLSGTPLNNHVGDHDVIVNVTDGNGGFFEQLFVLTVTNAAPEIITMPAQYVDEDSLVRIDHNSTDDGQGEIEWTLTVDAGDWLVFNGTTGVLSGTPTNDDVGGYSITINVSDGNGGYDEIQYSLYVNNTNDAPFNASIILGTDDPIEGTPVNLSGNGEDIDLIYGDHLRYHWFVNGSFIGEGKEMALNLSAGQYRIKLVVVDHSGESTETEYDITVDPRTVDILDPPDDDEPPVNTTDDDDVEPPINATDDDTEPPINTTDDDIEPQKNTTDNDPKWTSMNTALAVGLVILLAVIIVVILILVIIKMKRNEKADEIEEHIVKEEAVKENPDPDNSQQVYSPQSAPVEFPVRMPKGTERYEDELDSDIEKMTVNATLEDDLYMGNLQGPEYTEDEELKDEELKDEELKDEELKDEDLDGLDDLLEDDTDGLDDLFEGDTDLEEP